MKALVTGFTGKVGYEVAKNLKEKNIPILCAVRNVEKPNIHLVTCMSLSL